MGVDAYIFAEKSKRCYYFDRKHNLLSYEDHADQPAFAELKDRLNERQRLTSAEVLWMCQMNIEHNHRVGWNREIMRFVVRSPSDERFFVVSDHDGPSCHDVIEREGYTKEEYPEPMYWQRRTVYRKRQWKKREARKTAAQLEKERQERAAMIQSITDALSSGGYSARTP
jgi:hypothetical protein